MAIYNVSLADLSQDISGSIPVDLLLEWNNGEKSPSKHAQLLEPYRVRGTIACSDSAGLSKLSQQCTLAATMKLCSQPKELLFAEGSAIGGEAIGIWTADNSQMFYPESVDPADVVTQMLSVQRKAKSLTVQIGIGIHFADAYRIAGGLFGQEASLIEEITEERTEGAEVLMTDSVYQRLSPLLQAASRPRQDLQNHGTFWSIFDYQGSLNVRRGESIDYPTPFDPSFFHLLRSSSVEDLSQTNFSNYRSLKNVVFLKFARGSSDFLLDVFTEASLIELAIRRAAAPHSGDVIKSGASLAIVLFECGDAAINFARDIIQTNRAFGLETRVGITNGEVFVFPLSNGEREIAGNPVNIASKLSEDSGLSGILIENSVSTTEDFQQADPFHLILSKVELRGHRISA